MVYHILNKWNKPDLFANEKKMN